MAETAINPDQQQLTPEQFAQSIKTKFPQYKSLSDADLTAKMLEKYPQYRSRIKQPAKPKPLLQRMQEIPGQIQQYYTRAAGEAGAEAQRLQGVAAEPTKYEGGKPVGQQSWWTRAKASIQSAIPGTEQVLDKLAAGLTDPKTVAAFIVSKLSPSAATAFFATQSGKTALDAIQNGQATPENVQNFLMALAGVVGSVGAAGGEAPFEAARINKITGAVANAPELIRRGSQVAAGVGPERTTRPLVEKYQSDLAKAEEKQVTETKETDVANRGKMEKYQDQKRAALREEEEQRAAHTLEKEEVDARNQAQQEIQTRRGTLARNINQESKAVGDDIKTLEQKVRAQGNQQYNAVKARLMNDPGTAPNEAIKAVKEAKTRILKGSPESIREFNSLIRRAPAEEAQEALGAVRASADPAAKAFMNKYDALADEEGNEAEAKPLKFDDWQGYSSEIGDKLAKGNLPGDVYQALKFVKEAVDREKFAIADRNAVGGELKKADAYWRGMLETFSDKPSAVAQSLKRVGVMDPEYYAEPLVTGKSAKVGIEKLRKYDPELADRVEDLRKQNEEFKGLPKKAKVEAVPEAPGPVAQPGKPELKAPKTIEKPTAPGLEEAEARKRLEIGKTAREVQRLSKYDMAILASSAIGPFLGHWSTLLIDPALIVARKGLGAMLDRPALVKWLSKPGPEDIRILKEAAPEAQEEAKTGMANFIKEEEAHGKKVMVAPEIKSWLGTKAAGLVKRGKEIIGGEEGSATVPGTGEDLDARLKSTLEQSSSVGADEGGAFDKARQELYPDTKELNTKQTGEVSRRAAEITASRKASTGARQAARAEGEQSPPQKTPSVPPIVGQGRAIMQAAESDPMLTEANRQQRGRAAEVRQKYPVRPINVAAMRRYVISLREQLEEDPENPELKQELKDAEKDLRNLNGQ